MRLPPIALRAAHRAYRLKWLLLRPITTGVRILVMDGDHVLLVRHTYQPGWFLPGGGVKRAELLEEAARRELREETGLEPASLSLAGVYTNTSESKTDHVILFRAEASGTPHGTSPEVAEARWFPMDALPPDCARGTRQRIFELATGRAPAAPLAGRW